MRKTISILSSFRFQIYLVYLLLTMVHSNWSTEWSSWSDCSHSCGGGIQTRTGRACQHSTECERTSQSWRACALHLCPPPFTSWRDAQCAVYNDTLVGGEYHKWVSTMSRDAPCSLDCRSEDHPDIAQRFSDVVQDGTVCGEGALKMCLAGVCEEVGCNLELRSGVRLDRCGVCGGNGLSCAEERYSWEKEALIQCSTSCGGGRRVFEYFCVEIGTMEKVHFEFCNTKERPQNYFEICNSFSCPSR